MSELVMRAYNVGFGDALLISIPERDASGHETDRHLLIDVGNLLAGTANKDEVFLDVVRDIIDRTGGEVDLYVMTHEHLDHTQGLLAASREGLALKAKHAWLTGSAHPQYYERNPEARKRKQGLEDILEDAQRALQASPDAELELLLLNNSALLSSGPLGLTTAEYIDHLRTLAPAEHTHYVDRTTETDGKHPFEEAKLTILAPEADTSTYYGRAGSKATLTLPADVPTDHKPSRNAPDLTAPPPGVDPGAYFDLLRSRSRGLRENLKEIDAANNNTSVVLQIEWRGWRLLLPGDAELKSWRTMSALGLHKPAHVIKVSHHGSHNGTLEEIFDEVLPPQSPDGRQRFALVSTHDDSWESVPDHDTLEFYKGRCILRDTRTADRGKPVEVALSG